MDADFGSFLAAVREYEDDRSEVRVTAHTSSVTTADWQRVEAAIAAKRG